MLGRAIRAMVEPRGGCRAVGFKDPAGRGLLLVIICHGKTSNITATGQRRFWVEFLGRNYLVEVTWTFITLLHISRPI